MSITKAQGFFDLGLFDDAWLTIDDLQPAGRDTRDALELRLKILSATERWSQCQFLAEGLVKSSPAWPLPYLLGAEALDKQGNIKAALAFLTAGEEHLQDEHEFWSQLALYRSKVGDALGAQQAHARLAELVSGR